MIEQLRAAPRDVFSVEQVDRRVDHSRGTIKSRLSHHAQAGRLHRVRQGIYATHPDYDPTELVNLLENGAYISFQSAHAIHATIDPPDRIQAAGYRKRVLTVDSTTFHYRQITQSIRESTDGITHYDNRFPVASLERAWLDGLYLKDDPDDYCTDPDAYDSATMARLMTAYPRRVQKETRDQFVDFSDNGPDDSPSNRPSP